MTSSPKAHSLSLLFPRRSASLEQGISFPTTRMRDSLTRCEGGACHSNGVFRREIRLEAGWARTDGDLTSAIVC